MGTAASVLALLSFWFEGVPMKRTEWTGRAVLIGLVSAALSLCDSLRSAIRFPGWLFRFAPHQVSAIYDIRHEGSPLAMALVLAFHHQPRRGGFSGAASSSAGSCTVSAEKAGWLLAVCVYAGGPRFFREPHAGHGRPDGGAVLGLALLENRQPRPPASFSHAFWTVAVFILWPLTPGV
ncbi:CPBP family intramembrane glutamic endopeptidase [Bilophila wadsworthia]|uniref:CPBP family intramembrane glutamic endopeptidase n=1 Tax=Bilophila wadsworthia TaxID=35833 RepID=UPI003F96BDCF